MRWFRLRVRLDMRSVEQGVSHYMCSTCSFSRPGGLRVRMTCREAFFTSIGRYVVGRRCAITFHSALETELLEACLPDVSGRAGAKSEEKLFGRASSTTK